MELILEKCGFKNITYKEEFFGDEDHMIFVAEANEKPCKHTASHLVGD